MFLLKGVQCPLQATQEYCNQSIYITNTDLDSLFFNQDNLLRRPQLPGPALGVQQWLHGHLQTLQLLQLHPCQRRSLGGLWEALLHGVPVHPQPGRVPRLSLLDGLQQLHPLLSDVPPSKSIKQAVRTDSPPHLPLFTLYIKYGFRNGCQSLLFWFH